MTKPKLGTEEWAEEFRKSPGMQFGAVVEIEEKPPDDGKEYTPRGFRIYGRVTDSKNQQIRVQQSSAMETGLQEGPFVWVFTQHPDGPEETPRNNCDPHLSVSDAKELIDLLLTFVEDQAKDVRPSPVTHVSLDDIQTAGFDPRAVDEEQLGNITDHMQDSYTSRSVGNYWDDLEMACVSEELPRLAQEDEGEDYG